MIQAWSENENETKMVGNVTYQTVPNYLWYMFLKIEIILI